MGEAVVSGGDPAEILEAAEHALDRVAITVEVWREATLPHSGGLGRDIGAAPLLSIWWRTALVSDPLSPCRITAEAMRSKQDIGSDAVRHLAAGQQERDRVAEAIGQGMDFRRPSATRAADRLAEFRPLPPAAQR